MFKLSRASVGVIGKRRSEEVCCGTGQYQWRRFRIAFKLHLSSEGASDHNIPVFSDFKEWDIGPRFYEDRFDGIIQNTYRTAPLWGVGSSAPYGHDGSFSNLRSVIIAHGGAAKSSSQAFRRLPTVGQTDLLVFLESLTLYSTFETLADIDGKGAVTDGFISHGHNLGTEVFQPRYLFNDDTLGDAICCIETENGSERPVFRPRVETHPWGDANNASSGTVK